MHVLTPTIGIEISIGNIYEGLVSELLISNAIKVGNLSLDQFIDFINQSEDNYQQYRVKKYIYKNNKILEK